MFLILSLSHSLSSAKQDEEEQFACVGERRGNGVRERRRRIKKNANKEGYVISFAEAKGIRFSYLLIAN